MDALTPAPPDRTKSMPPKRLNETRMLHIGCKMRPVPDMQPAARHEAQGQTRTRHARVCTYEQQTFASSKHMPKNTPCLCGIDMLRSSIISSHNQSDKQRRYELPQLRPSRITLPYQPSQPYHALPFATPLPKTQQQQAAVVQHVIPQNREGRRC